MGIAYTHEIFVEKLECINPTVKTLGSYVKSCEKILVECSICGYKWSPTPNSLLSGHGCPKCTGHIKRDASDILRQINEVNPNILVESKCDGVSNKIHVKCKVCGHCWDVTPSNIFAGNGCPECRRSKMSSMFAQYTPQSFKQYVKDKYGNVEVLSDYQRKDKKVECRCLNCGAVFKILPLTLIDNTPTETICKQCSDGVSYPNKFSRNLLCQLPVDNVEYEYYPSWGNGCYYDNYFEYKNLRYVLEMDGAFHYKDNTISGTSLEEAKHRDREKDMLARQNGIEVIRIDSRVSELDYLQRNIINSRLGEIFDLSIVDWNECERKSRSNLVREVCEYYENSEDLIKNIAQRFRMSEPTVRGHLKIGAKVGWCSYPHDRNAHIDTYRDGKLLLRDKTVRETITYLFGDDQYDRVNGSVYSVLHGKVSNAYGYVFKYMKS